MPWESDSVTILRALPFVIVLACALGVLWYGYVIERERRRQMALRTMPLRRTRDT